MRLSHWVEALLGIALLLVAFAQYTVYSRQKTIMGRQASIAADQAKIMTTEARISDDGNGINIAMQRAYVIVDDVLVEQVSDKGPGNPTWLFYPRILNVGNTQTKNMRVEYIGGEAVDRKDQPSDPAKLFSGPPFREGDNQGQFFPILAPHSVYKVRKPPHTLVWADFNSMTARASQGIFQATMGVIRYNDIFPGTPERITKWCFLMHPQKGEDGKPMLVPAECAHWNCADSECKDDEERWRQDWAQIHAERPSR